MFKELIWNIKNEKRNVKSGIQKGSKTYSTKSFNIKNRKILFEVGELVDVCDLN